MALTTILSSAELGRVAALAYEGLSVRVSLHVVGSTGYDQETPIADWDTVKLPELNGYTDFVLAALPPGGYDPTSGRWEMGGTAGIDTYISATFTGADAGFTYDRAIVRIGTGDYPHSVLTESPSVSVPAGVTQSYQIQLLARPIAP